MSGSYQLSISHVDGETWHSVGGQTVSVIRDALTAYDCEGSSVVLTIRVANDEVYRLVEAIELTEKRTGV